MIGTTRKTPFGSTALKALNLSATYETSLNEHRGLRPGASVRRNFARHGSLRAHIVLGPQALTPRVRALCVRARRVS